MLTGNQAGSSLLLEGMFSTPLVTAALDDHAVIRAMIAFEVALAEAEEACGVIPAGHAARIAACADPTRMDANAIAQAAVFSGNIAIPFVRAMTAQIAAQHPESARYVHWGATSQDVTDTATVLRTRDAVNAIMADVTKLEDLLAIMVQDHGKTVLPGRTWLQHAVPVTLGLKAAGWLSGIRRARAGLDAAMTDMAVLQFGGAAGTLASLGGRGLDVATALAARLELALPPMPWHTDRGALVALGASLGVLCGALGKLARDLSLMMQTELAEILPPGGSGQGGSSTMPHKRNPVGCAIALSVATQAPGLVATLLSAMPQEQERGLGGWHAEWQTLPALLRLTAASAARMVETVGGMEIRPEAMQADLGATHGLMMAEAVSMALAEKLGKETAHHVLEQACRVSSAQRRDLASVLAADARVAEVMDAARIETLLDPSTYLGMAQVFCERVLQAAEHNKNRKG